MLQSKLSNNYRGLISIAYCVRYQIHDACESNFHKQIIVLIIIDVKKLSNN